VVVVAAAVVLVRVVGGGSSGSGRVADISGTPTRQREDLAPLPVDVPPVTAEADAACPALMSALPLQLAGEQSRPVKSNSPFAYAWGDPPVVLVCGVDPPAGFRVGSGAIQINGVQWYVDTGDPAATVWTTVDRTVPVQVRVPPTSDSAPVTALCPLIAKAVPFQQPSPAP
jgi:hypothetical protein